jgi:hypothetical protein
MTNAITPIKRSLTIICRVAFVIIALPLGIILEYVFDEIPLIESIRLISLKNIKEMVLEP